jgi:hypothetical protein
MDVSAASGPSSLAQLQARANDMIAGRLATLQKLEQSVSSDKTLTASDSAALMSELQNSAAGLGALQTTIAGETNPAKVRQDMSSIVKDFRVYRLVEPQVKAVEATDRAQSRIAGIGQEITAAQAKIAAAASGGANVDALTAELAQAQADLAKVDPSLGNSSAGLLAMTPAGFDQNTAGAMTQLRSSAGMAHAANQYASQAQVVMEHLLHELG